MTSRQSYGFIDPNRISYVYIVGMQSKYKYMCINNEIDYVRHLNLFLILGTRCQEMS